MSMYIFFEYVCPTLGCLMSAAMFAAPVNELRSALEYGSLGPLNPVPWAIMMGNCIGWCAYAYYAKNPFILASNLPGLILSVWLNMGAAKLQYLKSIREKEEKEIDTGTEVFINIKSTSFVPQETILLSVIMVWAIILICIGWLGLFDNGNDNNDRQLAILGILVNINLVFFYGAPLQKMHKVVKHKSSESIHVPTMVMNWFNTTFWISYGIAERNPAIFIPNIIGLCLGIAQGILCMLYPSRIQPNGVDVDPFLDDSKLAATANNKTKEIEFPGTKIV